MKVHLGVVRNRETMTGKILDSREALCGLPFGWFATAGNLTRTLTSRWAKVTCKNCLKQRTAKSHALGAIRKMAKAVARNLGESP